MKRNIESFLKMIFLVIAICSGFVAAAQQPVVWSSFVNASVNGSGLIKTGATGSGGAISSQYIPAGTNGYMEFLLGSGNNGYIGLSTSNPDANANTINYAFRCSPSMKFDIYENGVLKYDGTTGPTLTATTLIRVERTANTIYYKWNGMTLYTSTQTGVYQALYVDTSMPTTGNTLPGVTMNWQGTWLPPGGTSAYATSNSSIFFRWNDNSATETGFEVERSLNPTSGFALIFTTAPNALNYTNTGLATGTTYYYRARAVMSGSQTPYSAVVQATTFENAPWYKNGTNVFVTDGNIGIGTAIPDAKLAVRGNIHAQEVKVDLAVPGPDYVFDSNYSLLSLEEVNAYIQQYKHLPEVPSAKVMEAEGVELGNMNMLLLKKIEELTLHVIQQQKLIVNQEKRLAELEQRKKD